MKTEELKEIGMTDAQVAAVMKLHGQDTTKLQRENEALKTQNGDLKAQVKTAEETLQKFDGIDPEKVQKELEAWKKAAGDAKRDYEAKLEQRDFEDALREAAGKIKFTSEAAKRAVMGDIRAAGLKVKDGKILGLNDLVAQLREKDASAFVDDQTAAKKETRAAFTQPLNTGAGGTRMTKDQIMGIKDTAQRQQAIHENMDLFRAEE